MNLAYIRNTSNLKIFSLTITLLLASNNSLANLNKQGSVYTQNGYPYEGLVKRSEEVKILYTEIADKVTCRVEVLQNGRTWRGEAHNTSVKNFTEKPLRACMDRVDAKKLLANTF